MSTIIINDDNLSNVEIDVFSSKARAILLSDNKILVSHYGGVILLPGGSLEEKETPIQAVIRELREEIGIDYDVDQLKDFFTLEMYQKDYQLRHDKILNRKVTNYYYLGDYKGIDLDRVNRTEKEKRDDFYLQLVELSKLEDLLKEKNANPRKIFFDRELNEVVKMLYLKR